MVTTNMSHILAVSSSKNSDKPSTEAFGFWVYLMSDAVIFTLLFATYLTMTGNTNEGPSSRELFDLRNAFHETLLLLFSTLTCGFSLLSADRGKKIRAMLWLVITFALGLNFVLLEYHEFYGMIHNGAGPDRSGFLSAFFTLVGTHGLHVSIGLLWLLVMLVQIGTKGLTVSVHSRLYRFSLFWHFLDLIWVGIFSVVYLLGVL
jgi:cytochrome o ubiquinol oxidase subunit 3